MLVYSFAKSWCRIVRQHFGPLIHSIWMPGQLEKMQKQEKQRSHFLFQFPAVEIRGKERKPISQIHVFSSVGELQKLVFDVWVCFIASGSLGFLVLITKSTKPYGYEPQFSLNARRDGSSSTYEYTRFSEVEKECRSVISSASELNPNSGRWNSFKDRLSFMNGDWVEVAGSAPRLMPFDDSTMLVYNPGGRPPLQFLASFKMLDFDMLPQSKTMVNVSGVLVLGIGRDVVGYKGMSPQSPDFEVQFGNFQIQPGYSQLTIPFEGVFVESQNHGGEFVMCMLGSAMLPSRQPDSTGSLEWANVPDPNHHKELPLLQDDRVLLILRYPRTFTLTSRAIRGEMKSLNQVSNPKYFDTVHIYSQLGAYSNYQFGSQDLVSKACKPYPHKDDLLDSRIEVFKGFGFCEIFERFSAEEPFTVVPNWKCNSTDRYCRKMGPFAFEKEINATDGGFGDVRILIQDVRCDPGFGKNNASTARVSAVFRVIPPLENQFYASQRSGLGGRTLVAEGIWNSSGGQLCMVGCVENVAPPAAGCYSRICLYIPISFTITQRSIIFGQISSISNETNLYFPLSLEKKVQPSTLWNRFSNYHLSYKYSKIKSAGVILEKNEAFDFSATVKKSLLTYPTQKDGDESVGLSVLSEDLTLHVEAVDPPSKVGLPRPFIQMEILSIGPLFGRYWSSENTSTEREETLFHSRTETTERQILLNVSAELRITGERYRNVSMLFVEGLYNPIDGKMYLVGCRDVRASWSVLFESSDLENGLDCLIEAKVEYPPTTARWLMNPTAKISITSQRNDDDPLHFSPIKLSTLPILYRGQREDILSRKGVEGVLRILTLSLAIACIISQLLHIQDKVDVVPYISLVMLGVQALGYSLPLITGAEALFAHTASESYRGSYYGLKRNLGFRVISYTVKLLVLAAFLLTLRLGQKVWKSRIRLLTRTPLEPHRVPSDKRVLLTTLAIHTVGFLIILIVHAVNASKRPIYSEQYVDLRGISHKLQEWEIELEEYIGLVQDFFLLPQIIGNLLWQIDCKPLRKAYYIGVTIVRLLPHVYDYIRAPVFNPYFSEEYEFVNPDLDFYSKFGDIAIPATATILAVTVYIQQRWTYRELSQKLNFGQHRLLPLGSRVYERLPSKLVEAELVSGMSETAEDGHASRDED
ncbi:hypothetical protein MRB53_005006 [Persea americana]|uniref:Uncharacterized protein n=1 Tax=Persea americana TaxID=3435 RepID=A0ACC2MCW0_PERAE|nr:hypothetical protein MRB53_005006 [Persea americana]